MRTRTLLASALSVAGLVLALVLLAKHYGVPLLGEAALQACGEGGGCDIVDQSRFAKFLGFPLAAWGLLLYGSLLALLLPRALASGDEQDHDRGTVALAWALVALALVIDVFLLGLQAFVIKAYCKFCLFTYLVNIVTLALLWPARKGLSSVASLLGGRGLGTLMSWGIASVAVGTAVFATNAALVAKKALAGATILGLPSSTPAPAPNAPTTAPVDGSMEAQLAAAKADAAKWKATLDDPQKLQAYLTQKRIDDFNATEKVRLDLSRAPAKGPANAPIVVVEYADFMCPFCRQVSGAFSNYLKQSGDRVKIHFKNFPLDTTCNAKVGRVVHEGACELAKGAVCAREAGRFWEFHDSVFSRDWQRATREDVVKVASAVGLDTAKFSNCLDSAATKGLLAADIDEGWNVGVGSTPTIFVNGKKLESADVFLLAIEEESKKLGFAPPGAKPLPNQ